MLDLLATRPLSARKKLAALLSGFSMIHDVLTRPLPPVTAAKPYPPVEPVRTESEWRAVLHSSMEKIFDRLEQWQIIVPALRPAFSKADSVTLLHGSWRLFIELQQAFNSGLVPYNTTMRRLCRDHARAHNALARLAPCHYLSPDSPAVSADSAGPSPARDPYAMAARPPSPGAFFVSQQSGAPTYH